MRTTKRFTPQVLARFERQARGLGAFEAYTPWHQVTRGDPASEGRSHLLCWNSRLRHLLSDHEWGGQLFGLMLPQVIDSTEQKPLALGADCHPLSQYSVRAAQHSFVGTIELAQELGIKHPRLSEHGVSRHWTLSSDLVLVLQDANGLMSMVAVAIKPKGWSANKRTGELLRLEREYWLRRQVDWLLITPEVWSKQALLTLRRICPWALAEPVDKKLRGIATELALANPRASVTRLIEAIELHASSRHTAQRALWQAVFFGDLPVDLRRGWRPQEPLDQLSQAEFWKQNPIAARRSAWI